MKYRCYTVEFQGVAITAASGTQDLFMIAPAAQKPISVYGLFLGQTSEVADAQDELLVYQVIRGHTTVGSGGTTPTPVTLNDTDTAAGFTARANDTTVASAGTPKDLHSDTFNLRVGEKLWLPPDGEWGCSLNIANNRLVVRLAAAVADDIAGATGTLYVREYSG